MSKRNPFDKKREILRNILINMRKSQNITQLELAGKLNKPQSFVSKYENGERNLDFVEVYQICKLLTQRLDILIEEYEQEINI